MDAELRLGELQEMSDSLDLGSGETLVERAQIILDASSGVARCGMSLRWDHGVGLGYPRPADSVTAF